MHEARYPEPEIKKAKRQQQHQQNSLTAEEKKKAMTKAFNAEDENLQ